jgi:hypothetical protein
MAKKPLRSQLNQVRAWVQQGRTDAWIAHQLDVSTAELREFTRRHELSADEEGTGEIDLRDEIEAEIEAALDAADEEDDEEDELEAEDGDEVELEDEESGEDEDTGGEEAGDSERTDASEDAGDDGDGDGAPKRRRRRRGGRGRGRARKALEATFDHGEKDGYGLWLDPAVKDDPVYAEHWAGHRAVEVSVQPEQIVIKRTDDS